MKKFVPVLVVVLMFFIFVSCSKQEEPKETSEVQAEVYDVAGMVVSLDSENNTITIAHEDIPGFMSGMTMGFHVKDSTLLEGVQPEDSVQFELTVSEGEMWVSAIQKLE